MIEVPAKIWQPKVMSKYTTPVLDDDDVDDILNYAQYGKCVYKNNLNWSDDSCRNDIITYCDATHASELHRDLRFDESVDADLKVQITDIIKEYWDCFVKAAMRTILQYEFGIDTGVSKPVCCRKPSYGPYESRIIMEQNSQL